jgi:lymphocyte antigen 75
VKIVNELLIQSKANARCDALGGEILSIHSLKEQYFITAITADKCPLWIGLNYIETIRKWSWSDDSQVNFTNWAQDYPNGINNKCVYLLTNKSNAGQWLNVNCNQKFGVICETKKCKFYFTFDSIF